MSSKKIYVFAKEGLSQNLIHLALAELKQTFHFYHHLTELAHLTLTKSDLVIVDNSMFTVSQDIQTWIEKLKNQRCVFLLSKDEAAKDIAMVGKVLSKPFAPQDLRKLI